MSAQSPATATTAAALLTKYRFAAAGFAAGVVLLLAACSPSGPLPGEDTGPGNVPGGDPAGASLACAEAFPSATGNVSLDQVAGIVPADFPAPPAETSLCVVIRSSDASAVLQYVTGLDPIAVMEHYEAALAEGRYGLVRSDGIGDDPILNAIAPEVEFAVQTVSAEGTYFVAFGLRS